MSTKLSLIFATIFFLLSSFTTAANNEGIKVFTSNGVVYSYAVITSTIKPATVVVETHYYTTTNVREVTLSNSVVTSITEEITKTSTLSTTSPLPTTSSVITTNAVVASSIPSVVSSSSSTESTFQAPTSRITSTLSPQLSVDGVEIASSSMTSTTSSTSSSSSSTEKSAITSAPSVDSTTTTVSSSISTESPYTTVFSPDGKCSVYHDDDEYYSTVYLTNPTESVDAATTITSTRTVFTTVSVV